MSSYVVRAEHADQLLPETRLVAALLVPFLVAAFLLLYLLPDDTGRLFAWEVRPRMNAMLMGAGYLGGAYFFTRVALARRWHHVAAGFPPVATFATLIMVVTLLHWDRFNHGHISFYTWVLLYAVAPIIVPLLLLRQRRYDSGLPEAGDALLPPPARALLAAVGVLLLLTGLALFLHPGALIPHWPWPLAVPGARALGAWFVLPGVVGLTVARDPRWSSARIVLQSQLLGILLILAAVPRARHEFAPQNPLTWLFLPGMVALAAGLALLYRWMESRH